MSRSTGRVLALAALIAVLGAPASGAAGAHWTTARLLALPAAGDAVAQGYLPGLACPAVGQCVAAGDYQDAAGLVHGFTVAESRGAWGRARPIAPPPSAGSPASLTPAAVACGAVGDCAVVGAFTDAAGDQQAFVESEVSATWRSAQRVTLPVDAAGAGQVAQLHAVACASATSCVAVGSYRLAGAARPTEGLVVTERDGVWTAHRVDAPDGANVDPVVNLTQVACAGASGCVAAGTFIDADNATLALGVAVTASPSASVIDAPTNASAFPSMTVGSLACARARQCVAVGTYESATGQREGYAASSAGSSWRPAVALVMPAGAAANPRVFSYGFGAVSCSAPGACATGGQYVDAQGAFQGYLADEVNGVWRAAVTLPLPAGSAAAGANGGVVALSCPARGVCRAGAAYLDAHGRYQAAVVSETAQRWSLTTLGLPAGADSVGVDGGVYGLACASPTRCTATGTYLDAAGTYQGFAASLG